MRRRFFVDRFEMQSASLLGETADHLGRVLRAEPGQLYELSDGKQVWLARVKDIEGSKRGTSRVDFELVERLAVREDRTHVSLLLSIVKFDRFEWCLEKATELGIADIIPLAALRSDRALVAAEVKRNERWRKIVKESAQQARRLRPPEVHRAANAQDAFVSCASERKLLLSERPGIPPLLEALSNDDVASVALAIGPEGGWTDEEIAAARAARFQEASLGDTILRTETAVIAALAVIRFGMEGPERV